MSLGHGIIFGGMQEREDNGDRRIHLESQKNEEKPVDSWPGIKRAPGAHRIATHLREQGYDIEVIDFWPAWTYEQLLCIPGFMLFLALLMGVLTDLIDFGSKMERLIICMSIAE